MALSFSSVDRIATASTTLRRRGIPRVLAVASGGGHWVQLLRVTEAFQNCDVTFVTTHESYRSQVGHHRFRAIGDSNLSNIFGLLKTALQLLCIVASQRPHVVISTGAAPGYIALRLGRLIGAKTVWLDSIANIDQLSLSGKKVGRYADLWLTQWPHLVGPNGPHYGGSVL